MICPSQKARLPLPGRAAAHDAVALSRLAQRARQLQRHVGSIVAPGAIGARGHASHELRGRQLNQQLGCGAPDVFGAVVESRFQQRLVAGRQPDAQSRQQLGALRCALAIQVLFEARACRVRVACTHLFDQHQPVVMRCVFPVRLAPRGVAPSVVVSREPAAARSDHAEHQTAELSVVAPHVEQLTQKRWWRDLTGGGDGAEPFDEQLGLALAAQELAKMAARDQANLRALVVGGRLRARLGALARSRAGSAIHGNQGCCVEQSVLSRLTLEAREHLSKRPVATERRLLTLGSEHGDLDELWPQISQSSLACKGNTVSRTKAVIGTTTPCRHSPNTSRGRPPLNATSLYRSANARGNATT